MSNARDPRFKYDSNGKQIGLNWASIAPAATESAAAESGRPSVRATLPPERKSRRGPVSAASLANLTSTASRRYDYQEIADLWSAGKTNKEIMAKVGCGQSTVLLALKTIQPEGYTGKPGPRALDVCQNGHDLAVHGKRYKNQKNGRTCLECKRVRDRAWYAAKKKAAQ